MDHDRRRLAIRHDEIAGFWPGVGLAVGLGGISGATTACVFTGWIWLAGHTGLFEAGSTDLLAVVGWWAVFWVALSAGLLAGLWVGYRAWHALYPVQRRHEVSRAHRDALGAAEEILQAARATATREREG